MLYTGASEENFRKNHARKTRKMVFCTRIESFEMHALFRPSINHSGGKYKKRSPLGTTLQQKKISCWGCVKGYYFKIVTTPITGFFLLSLNIRK